MGVDIADAPQWLMTSWARTVHCAGATAPPEQIMEAGERLVDAWSRPDRHFHDLRHLGDVLRRVDELSQETHSPELVRLAAWYHGVVFDAADSATYSNKGGEDESASAQLAHDELTALGVPEESAQRVAHLVTALVRHAPDPTDFDCAVLCDADLAFLASEPQRYKEYLEDVRTEYAHIPRADFVRARIAILTKLLERPTLFCSPLGSAWEEPARQNIGAELQRLGKEQRKIEAASTSA
ncbi:putative metal-dependent HD superfamily phosphohydrolase [Sediminihabitans luteus]|uniref:Putative metal-dependent HD superfamily phosphohydrolase n=1 Tax=Sediminihabitans luteus TaxID=1138585 RepID=A0A2M9CE81_9CELL|nr:hypothetical protein [Sediminihabitans luteus]PJJ70187.1 putative metal-dependent HD superfamily phosphohydrolase [Sediminihabitans luteus]GII97658.1 hypothetical protein Slu03_00360 [Sediminihabitans luteus]